MGGASNTELPPDSLSKTEADGTRAKRVEVVAGAVAVTGSVTTNDSHTTAGAPLSVRLSDGSAFYTATGGGGGGGTSSNFAATFPAAGTAAGAKVVSSTPTYTNGNMEAPTLSTAGRLIVDGSGVTQPVSGTVTVTGTVTANAGTGTLAVSGPLTDAQLRAAAVPVSGTVTANIGTAGSLALDATLTGGTQRARITDGTNNAALAASAPAGTEQALIVRNIPSGTQTVSGTVTANAGSGPWPVTDNGGSLTVDGTVTANAGTGTFAVSGPLTDAQLRASAVPVSGTVTANAGSGPWPVTDNGSSLTVDGTVTANAGSGTFATSLATLPALTAGTARVGGTYSIGGSVIDEVPTVRSISRSFVNATASGNTQIVAAQGASIRIRVLAVFVVSSTAVSIKFQSATNDVSATYPIAANGGFVMPETTHGWFQTNANEALNINLSGAATNVGCNIVWVQAT